MFGINPFELFVVGAVSLGIFGCVVAAFVLLVQAGANSLPPAVVSCGDGTD